MTTIQIAGATDELRRALIAKEEEIDLDDSFWFEECFEINDVMEEVGLIVKLDWYSTQSDGFVQVGYWSDKIKVWIVLDSEVKFRPVDEADYNERCAEMAEMMVSYNDRARALEAKLPVIGYYAE